MPTTRLTEKIVRDSFCPDGHKRVDFFDVKTPGFMLEARIGGGKTYYARYRNKYGAVRQVKIGKAEILTLAEARLLARGILAQASLGEDPAEERQVQRAVPTLQEFVIERYLPYILTYKSPNSSDESILRNHVLPRFGHLHLDEIKKADLIAHHQARLASGAKPGTANKDLILMSYIFNLALKWELQGIKVNPAKGIPLFEENNKRERYLTTQETAQLYQALLESPNKQLRFIISMLILTGARKREVLDACWADFDLARRDWRIPKTKSGRARHVPLSKAAFELIESVPRFEGCPYYLPNPKTLRPFVSVFQAWNTARTSGGLADVRIHDLRHSFASFLINAGRSIYEVQKILGHTQISTTQRYSHLSQATLIDAADAVTLTVGNALSDLGEKF